MTAIRRDNDRREMEGARQSGQRKEKEMANYDKIVDGTGTIWCGGDVSVVRERCSRYLSSREEELRLPATAFLTAHPSPDYAKGESRATAGLLLDNSVLSLVCTDPLRCVNMEHSANIKGQRRATGHASAFECQALPQSVSKFRRQERIHEETEWLVVWCVA
jgi:hypothetical protein